MADAKSVTQDDQGQGVKYVDLRFTDPRGKMQHVTMDIREIDEDAFAEGFMFDGSSIAGWKAINESDMKLMPDPSSAHIDPFFAQTHARGVLRRARARAPTSPTSAIRAASPSKAEAYLKQTGVGDTALFGPEAEFFIFDDVRFNDRALQHRLQARLRSSCRSNTGHRLRDGQPRPPPAHQGRLLPGAAGRLRAGHPLRDALGRWPRWACRSRSITTRWPPPQHELGMKFGPLVKHGRPHADLQVRDPQRGPCLRQDRDLHAQADLRRQRLGHALPPVDLEGRQAGVRRQQVRRPLGDLPLLHRRRHQARQGDQRLHQPDSPTPTSVWCRATRRRCCSPTRRATARPRAASRSAPSPRPSASRCASPIPRANPYLGFSAMLMAGLDGIDNKIHPGRADGQEPLRPAAGGAREDPDGVRLAARGARPPRQGPRVPEEGRRVHRRPDRRLSRASDGRGASDSR